MEPQTNNPISPHDIQGEPGFERFVRETQARLRAFVRSKGLCPHDADDLAQEAYLTLWKRRTEVKEPSGFLFGIARTLVRAHYRKMERMELLPLDDAVVEHAHTTRLDSRHETSNLAATIRGGLALLPPRQQEVIELVWLQSIPRPEAARSLSISGSTLRVHEARALKTLLSTMSHPEATSSGNE